jgi:hypothetical protein
VTAVDQPRRTTAALPYVTAVALAVLYVVWAPHTADLAAQTARAELFRRSGYVPYWSGWYGGISTTSYSLVTPPLLGWLGAIWLGGISIVATGFVAVPLVRGARRPIAGATVIVIAAGLDVISGRTTFAVGVVVALLALWAAEHHRSWLAGGLGILATITSPVAGFLLLIIAAAKFLVDRGRRRTGLSIGIGVVVALGVIAWLAQGDGGGYQPFTRSSLLMAVGTALVVVIAPVGRRVRTAAWLTILALLVVYLVHTPIGANATRIAVLASAPAIVCAARGRLMMTVGFVTAALLPLSQLHNDLAAAADNDHDRGFVTALKAQLDASGLVADHRVELVDTGTHWASTYLLPQVVLARGWERQVDESRNPIFYGRSPLTVASYRSFLDRNAVGLVAVARGNPFDWGTRSEAALISAGIPYLHQIAVNQYWTVYAVTDPTPIVAAPAVMRRTTDTGLEFSVRGPGRYAVRLRWSPYLIVSGGTVSRAPDDSIVVTLRTAGVHDLHAVWRLP